MDGKKVLEVIAIYRQHLIERRGASKRDFPHDQRVLYKNDILGHCHGMLDQMEEFVRQGRMDKVFRWLGFVQGCLWATSCYDLNALKDHNRPAEKQFDD